MNRSHRRQRPEFAPPISVSLTHRHLALLDARRGVDGHLSRSAALREVLDRLLDLEQYLGDTATAQAEQTP